MFWLIAFLVVAVVGLIVFSFYQWEKLASARYELTNFQSRVQRCEDNCERALKIAKHLERTSTNTGKVLPFKPK